ncbi:MAG: Sau3AI family type II restriction endonuclease [Muribaculaceae bacterium]
MNENYKKATYDRKDPLSIFDYSKYLIGESLLSLFGNDVDKHFFKGKGGLGEMVEKFFFKYEVNTKREADFKEAGVELKCTPLLRRADQTFRIKERLVCTMIDYFEIAKTSFDDSHLLSKCRLMLLLFYLHIYGKKNYEYEFIFRVLWQLPEKDLMLIKQDYDLIAEKVRKGEAHLLSEGDTIYLGACRKGQKGDNLQRQPFSEVRAKKRAFSLKPAYTRYILETVEKSGRNYYSNFIAPKEVPVSIVDVKDLYNSSFEKIILNRFKPYMGNDYLQICKLLNIKPHQTKSKYADIASLIGSNKKTKRLTQAEEFIKSGIILKTVRLTVNGMPKESMSFKNIDYCEVFENDDWEESELYEIFTNRFMFVVFKAVTGETISIRNNRTGKIETEQRYLLDKIFFWTMPQEDLADAKSYWENIRQNVLANHIDANFFWSIKDHKKFHVRPKAVKAKDRTVNPNGGDAYKYCYWFNAQYIKQIIDLESND